MRLSRTLLTLLLKRFQLSILHGIALCHLLDIVALRRGRDRTGGNELHETVERFQDGLTGFTTGTEHREQFFHLLDYSPQPLETGRLIPAVRRRACGSRRTERCLGLL